MSVGASRRAVVAGGLLTAAAVAVLLPDPRSIADRGSEPRAMAGLLDYSLRVPLPSVLLRGHVGSLQPGDRLVGIRSEGRPLLANVATRTELRSLLRDASPGSPVTLAVGRGETTVRLDAKLLATRPLMVQWPIVLTGTSCLLFGILAIGSGRHPATAPLFAVSLCLGVAILSLLDLWHPEDRGLLGLDSLSSRAGALAWTLLPATLLHLSMRFPVLAARFRQPVLEVSPYVAAGILALVGQLRFGNAALGASIEQIALAASYAAGWVLIVTSLARARSLLPIELHRAYALSVGLGLGLVAPALLLLDPIRPPATATFLALTPLALPMSLAWAVARYRLLDPPVWLRSTLLSALSGLLVLLATNAAVSLGPERLSELVPSDPRALALAAIVLTALYRLTRSTLHRFAGRRSLSGHEASDVISAAMRRLSSASNPDEIAHRLARIVKDSLGAGQAIAINPRCAENLSSLAARGIELWQSDGAKPWGVSRLTYRSEDPGSDVPEMVLPVSAGESVDYLVIASSRPDGLPYSRDEKNLLDTLGRIASVSARASLSAVELERRVQDRTESLSRARADRERLLFAAERIFACDDAEGVFEVADWFFRQDHRCVRWEEAGRLAPAPGDSVVKFEIESGVSRCVVASGVEPRRARELEAPVKTVAALCRLALSRLSMLRALKEEVSTQSSQLDELVKRRQFGDLVQGVAHDLRKPADAIRRVASGLEPGDVDVSERAAEIVAIAAEMNRKLTLLLYQKGLRFDMRRVDLVPLVEEVAARLRRSGGARDYRLQHQLGHLPVVGDASRLTSLVENLLDNAVRATESGGQISIRTGLSAERGEGALSAWLEVEDDGVGIPPSRIDRIFDAGVSFSHDGYGLGLALCKEVAERHDGDVTVNSKPGRTTFRLEIPQLRGR